MSRVVYMVTRQVDVLPRGAIVRHRCGRGGSGCARPDHLLLGTRDDNARDRALRRRGDAPAADPRDEIHELDVVHVSRDVLELLAQVEGHLSRLRASPGRRLVIDPAAAVHRQDPDHYRAVRILGRSEAVSDRAVHLARIGAGGTAGPPRLRSAAMREPGSPSASARPRRTAFGIPTQSAVSRHPSSQRAADSVRRRPHPGPRAPSAGSARQPTSPTTSHSPGTSCNVSSSARPTLTRSLYGVDAPA